MSIYIQLSFIFNNLKHSFMKKSLLISCLALAASSIFAQSEILRSIVPDDEHEYDIFTYDENNRYIRHDHDDVYGYIYFDSLTYNALGQIEEDATYQDLDYSGNYILVTKCLYGYDEQGNLAWRDNYNSFGSAELTQSAHIFWTYDEQGRKLSENQCWADDPENPFMTIVYTYNEAGQLISATESMVDFWDPSVFEEVGVTEYTYDEQGRLASDAYSYINWGSKELASTEYYTYDELGNIVESVLKYPSGSIDNRHEFDYDTTVSAKDVIYPLSNEFKVGYNFGLVSKRLEERVYKTDQDNGNLELAYVSSYNYATAAVGIRSIIAGNSVFFNADTKVLNVGGDCMVRVFNMNGHVALSTTARGTANLSSLAPGVYIASVKAAGHEASYTKFVVR